eukprot:436093_1
MSNSSNGRKSDISHAPHWSPHPDQMATVVKNAIKRVSDRYQEKKEKSPLRSYEKKIVNYFKQNQIDGARFLLMTKQKLIRDLKQHTVGPINTSNDTKIDEAFNLLFVCIEWAHDLPHKRSSVISDISNGMAKKHKRGGTGIKHTDEKKSKPKMPNLKRSRGKSVMDTDPNAVWVHPSAFKCVLYQDIEFEWKHISEPRFLDYEPFIYVVSIIIDRLNHDYRHNTDEPTLLFNKSLILTYLYSIQMDGLLFQFNGSGCEQEFVENIKHIVFDTRVQDSDFLTERVKRKYAQRLYKRIMSFKLTSIDVIPSSKCKISFNPSVCNVKDDDLQRHGASLLSTLNQYQDIYSSDLTKPIEKRKIVKTLNECNDTINAVLRNKWTVYMKNEVQIWDHTIQSLQECGALHMLYVLDCILINKKFRETLKRKHKLDLEPYASKIMEYFEKYKISGEKCLRFDRLAKLLNDWLDPTGRIKDLVDHLTALLQIIVALNVFSVTAFYIKSDVEWNDSIQSLTQCTERDMIYIVLYLLSEDDALAKLTRFESNIVEYFVKHKINGSVFDHMKEHQFVDQLDKCIKSKSKSPLVKLFYGIKRCKMRDIANIAVQEDVKHSTRSKRGAFTKWDKRTTFKDIKRVGYKWEDGVIVMADVISPFSEQNKNKLQIHVRNLGTNQDNAYLTEPFWLTLPNSKLCKPTMESIEASHYAVFNKWMMILQIKNAESSEFEDNIFHSMALISQRHPQLLFTIRQGNYAVKLEHKTYDNVIQSFFAFSLRSKCGMSRCHHKPKIDCFCDANEFQRYTYHMVMAMMTQHEMQQEPYITRCSKHIVRYLMQIDQEHRIFKSTKGSKRKIHNAKALGYIMMEYAADSLLQILKTRTKNTDKLSRTLCSFLPQELRDNIYLNEYYIHHVQQWLLHDFYNVLCSHCGSVNKSIMINRVFRYSATLRNCRTCGVIVRARDVIKHHEINTLPTMNTYIMRWFLGHNQRVLEEQKINSTYLEQTLNDCVFNEDIASTHKENDVLHALELNERFDELTYYLSRFLDDVDDWKALRIKITADVYFYRYRAPFVSVTQFMNDAGIHLRHINIFKDCWSRALFQSVKDNQPLIDILNNIDRDDEQKSNINAKKDVLCTDLERLQIFRKLTPSISAFTTRFIQQLTQNSSNPNVDLFSLIQRFLDFKIDDNVFAVIHELELVSLIWNEWEYLTPPMLTSISYSNWSNYFGIAIECKHESLRSELVNELANMKVSDIDHQFAVLERKAMRLQKKKKTTLTAKASKWNDVIGVAPGTPISMSYIHAVLLFAEIPVLRHKICALLAGTALIEVHQRFGHLFKLLKEVIYLYGERTTLESMYYSMDGGIVLDKYRAMLNVPIIGSDRPAAFRQKHNRLMAECEPRAESTAFDCFNLAALMDDEAMREQDFYIFFGGPYDARRDIHLDRQRLRKGSKCQIYSNSRHKFLSGVVERVFIDHKGEWLRVAYSGVTKDIKRMSHHLLVVMYDKWHDIMKHFGGDTGVYHENDREPFNHPLFTRLMAAGRSILKEHEIQCTPELIFRIKTVLRYYKTSQNIIPDFDTFLKETNINVPGHKLDGFRETYQKETEYAQRQRLQNVRRSISLKTIPSRSSLMDILSAKNTLKLDDDLRVYDLGIFMRYDVNNPRFESLAEETMFNEVANISNERFNKHLMKAKEIHIQHCFMMLSKASDFHFGIEQYEPISIAHIMAVIIHTEEPKYSRDFSRSCLLLNRTDSEMVIQYHCNNFYWFGRYLYECIEYFGETMTEQSSTQQKQGLPTTFKFDLFAPLINFPRSTTKSLDMALHDAGDTGCVLEFVPKYNGVLNASKFIDLSTLSDDYDGDMRLFFGKGCAIQIKDIVLSNHHSLRNFILPLVYLEKLMTQTVFDRQFFNAEHLYDKEGEKSHIQYTLFNLLQSCVGIAMIKQIHNEFGEHTQLIMINKYFPLNRTGKNEILYVINLLIHWCSKRTFITFEAFAAELPFMVPKLRDFFVTKRRKHGSYGIHIDNLLIIMPKLKHYRDFDKQVVHIEKSSFADKLRRKRTQDDTGIINTINRNLCDYYLIQDAPYSDAKFANWCTEQRFTDEYIEEQMKAPFESFDDDILQFDRDFPFPIDTVQFDLDKSRQVWQILRYAAKPGLLKLLYTTSDYYTQSPNKGSSRRQALSHQRLSVSSPSVVEDGQYAHDEYNAIYRALSNCQQHEIPDEICDILENLEYFNHEFIERELKKYSFRRDSLQKSNSAETNRIKSQKLTAAFLPQVNRSISVHPGLQLQLSIKKDAIRKWKNRNRPLLTKFYGPISKLHKASKHDFVTIAYDIGIFDDENMIHRLCAKLMERLFTDIERMKPWKCRACWFMNRKMMIGGLWCLYNQLNECGLCGEERHKINKSNKHPENRTCNQTSNESTEDEFKLPHHVMNEWKDAQAAEHDDEISCTIKDHKKEQIYLERWTVKTMKRYVTKYAKTVPALHSKKREIIHFFDEHRMDGQAFLNTTKTNFIAGIRTMVGDRKLTKHLSKLHGFIKDDIKAITVYCKPMKRIAIILNQYHSWTAKLHQTNHRYPYRIRHFLSALGNMSRVSRAQLVDDVEHMMRHTPAIRKKQPYVRKTCKSDGRCIHQIRIGKHGDIHLTMAQKCNLFNCDDWKDFVYILYLDKIHCVLFHDIKGLNLTFLNDRDKDIIRRYSIFEVYSTGVYIDHASLSSLHVNLKSELIHNTAYEMDERTFNESVKQSKHIMKQKLKEVDKWKAKESNEIYGIKIGDSIQMEHVLVIYLYTSISLLCTKFRESYRCTEHGDTRAYHINHFYWMGRFIYAAIQFFGDRPRETDRLYHGLKKQFLFTEFSTIFEFPTSTTTSKDIARTKFAGDNGIILTLGPKFKNELNNNKYLDVAAISRYGQEKERLFAGMTVLAVINIEYKSGGKCKTLGEYAAVLLYFERIVEQTIHNKNYYNYAIDVSKETQHKYLWPLMDHQIKRNSSRMPNQWNLNVQRSESKEDIDREMDEYLYALFEHFCDSKRDYINLTCINDEIESMDEMIRDVFFNDKKEINDENLQLLFPKLKGYKNHLGYWIHFEL